MLSAEMQIALVINRSAGGFRRYRLAATVAAIRAAFEAAGHRVDLWVVGRRELPGCLAAQAGRADLDAVVVGGGDGTILAAVDHGLGRDRPLGILPLGTLNLFARDIGLPLDPVAAAAAVATARPGAIDLAELNGRPFAIWAALGLHPWVVRRRDHLQRRGWRKAPAMALALLRGLLRWAPMTLTLRLDDAAPRTLTTPLLVVSNNAWREETPPLSRDSLAGGRLDVLVADCPGRLALLALAVETLCGRWRGSPRLRRFSARELRIDPAARRALVSLDGEVAVLGAPLRLRVRPRALRVLMPAGRNPAGSGRA
ncbi:MAG: hypothetical protein RLZZ501_103 [Pseudomonadota bacterium]|jgi:diacylglycerol kinase family enzyme